VQGIRLASFCGKRKGDAKDWLLGFEGSKEKSIVMKYTVTLLGKWDEEGATVTTLGEPSLIA
jgi:hypothetical protein